MRPCVINVATGRYVRGQKRLAECIEEQGYEFMSWTDRMPPGSPSHLDIPFAFKAWAMKAAMDAGFTTLLWADSCILPVAPIDALFEKIEREGCWISNNGWTNAEWTADSAYSDLNVTREENEGIKHVVATTFGLDVEHATGRAIFEEYSRLAKTRAFCGPTWNSSNPEYRSRAGARPCGPPSTRGHRHDQSALSVAAWRAGVELTNPPEWFCYRGGETAGTVLVADGAY